MFDFKVDKKLGNARLTTLTTPHGAVRGPFFQFVATQAAIRGQVYSEDLEKLGVQIVLANTYHLHLRPGEQLIAEANGLHEFMQWDQPITTDSGGYQVFSLGQNVKIDPDGVTFRSPINGDEHRFTPESTIDVERQLGADIIMPLDIATSFDATQGEIEQAVAQTITWAKRCQAHHLTLEAKETKQVLYGIVQGGLVPGLRAECAAALIELDFFGYSIGGELRDASGSRMDEGVAITVDHLPEDKPRYLMGSGSPVDIVQAVRRGVDHFDCVLPIRDARHGRLYRNLNHDELRACLVDAERPVAAKSLYETFDISHASHASSREVFAPSNPAIGKPYTMGYVHHLLRTEPPSGYRLAVLNNIFFYLELFSVVRDIIEA